MTSDVLICPDCGGVIGARSASAQGKPCTCFLGTSTELSNDASSETSTDDSPKLCVVCGKNVSGHRRYKDSRGYICLTCYKQERSDELGADVVCSSCLRSFPQGRTVPDERGGRICQKCEVRQDMGGSSKSGRAAVAAARNQDKKMVRLQMAIFAGLILLVYLIVESGMLHLPGMHDDIGDATMLLKGARALALTFLVFLVALVVWIKRSV